MACFAVAQCNRPTDVSKKDNASHLGVSQTTRVVLNLPIDPAGKDEKGAMDNIPVTATSSSDKTDTKRRQLTSLTHSQ